MARLAPLLRALGCLALVTSPAAAHAQTGAEPSAPSPAAEPTTATAGVTATEEEIHTMRRLLEQQSRQIETLTQQVAKLTALLESARATGAAPAPAQNMPPVSAASPLPAEPPEAALPGAPAPGTPGATHVVTKGETLTVIAKHYKVSVADLLKANKIGDERKLQIGQTLIIPASAKPAAESQHPQ